MANQRTSVQRLLPTYAALVGIPAAVLFAILRVGDAVSPGVVTPVATGSTAAVVAPATASTPNLPLLLVQIIVILVLASVGEVDSSKGPILYFEIRYQGKPVDPAPWFR